VAQFGLPAEDTGPAGAGAFATPVGAEGDLAGIADDLAGIGVAAFTGPDERHHETDGWPEPPATTDPPTPPRTTDPPTPSRPADPPPTTGPPPDGACTCGGRATPVRLGVDLQVELATLMCLNDNPALVGGWGPVIADIARQVAADRVVNPAWKWSVTDTDGNLLHHGHTRRRPTPTERAFVHARDRTCRFPGCRQPARTCDEDHRHLWSRGGASHRGNLCVLCRHHHRLRHEHGYRHHQIRPGHYLWQTPHGRHLRVTPAHDVILTTDGR
jgi:hypothetical protein